MTANNDIKFYILKCITNLHVGSGDSGFSIVDKQVERDELTRYPMIYSSSLKGALREFLQRKNCSEVENIFGGEGNSEKAGKVKFLDAHLLALPMRASKGQETSYMVTTKQMLEHFIRFLRLSGHTEDTGNIQLDQLSGESQVLFKKEDGTIEVEGIKLDNQTFQCENLKDLLKKVGITSLILLSDKDFKECSLPVRARNNLNKKARNLWYEEHVPYNSIFYTMMMETGEEDSKEALIHLSEKIDNQKIQVGANASVGFGWIDFQEFNKEKVMSNEQE